MNIYIMNKVIKGIKYLYSNGIIHLDIKPSNICLKYDVSPAIIDFGISKYFKYQNSRFDDTEKCYYYKFDNAGTKGFAAPEISEGKEISEKYLDRIDIYSVGATMYYLQYCKAPEFDNNKNLIFDKDDDTNIYVKNFLSLCLQSNIENRINITDALNSNIFDIIPYLDSKKNEFKNKYIDFYNFLINNNNEIINKIKGKKVNKKKKLKEEK